MEFIHEIGTYKSWKFGLITREIYRHSDSIFEINDFSNGWAVAIIDEKTMRYLISGEISITDINFE